MRQDVFKWWKIEKLSSDQLESEERTFTARTSKDCDGVEQDLPTDHRGSAGSSWAKDFYHIVPLSYMYLISTAFQ